ncbi:MAG: type I-E CRISPR-associated protein Cse2/CasB [Acidobacteriota bacterium]|nr:type I-E CRISPR-associated protein Cse2/CasB [Acidobacteriota bacterium]
MSNYTEQKRNLEKCFFGYINYLESLVPDSQKKTNESARQNTRAALAYLRRGLGRKAGTAVEMLPYIMPYAEKLPEGLSSKQREKIESSYFLVGSLIGLYPKASRKSEDKGRLNLGKSLLLFDREISKKSPNLLKSERNSSVEKRFVALLNADEEDLPNHLRQIISLLKSKEIPINWLQLLKDINDWSYESKSVQRNWAREFWGNTNTTEVEGEEKQ